MEKSEDNSLIYHINTILSCSRMCRCWYCRFTNCLVRARGIVC